MLKKISTTFFTKALTAFINLGVAILLSRWLGAEGKGFQSLFIAGLGLSTTITGVFGIISLTYLVPKKPSLNYFFIANGWALLASSLVFLVVHQGQFLSLENSLWLSLTTLLSALATNNLSIYLIKERITRYNFLLFAQPLLNILLIATFYHWGSEFTVESYIHTLSISYLALFILSLHGAKCYLKGMQGIDKSTFWKDVKAMFRYGFLNQTGTFIQLLSFRGSYYLLERLGSLQDVGIFSNAVSITEAVWIINRSLSLVFYSRIINSTSTRYHQKLYQRFVFFAFWSQTAALLALVLVPAQLYTFFFGAEFSGLKHYIVLLLPASFLFGQSLLSSHYFSGTGRHQINLWSSMANLLIVLLGGWFLIGAWGATGAALATNFGYLALVVVQHHYLKKHLSLPLWSGLLQMQMIKRLLYRTKHKE